MRARNLLQGLFIAACAAAFSGCAAWSNMFYGEHSLPCDSRKTDIERNQCRAEKSDDLKNDVLRQDAIRRDRKYFDPPIQMKSIVTLTRGIATASIS